MTIKHSPHYERAADKSFNLATAMKSLFMNPDLADFKFVVTRRDFPVHKPIAVLAKIFLESSELPEIVHTDHIRNFDTNCLKLLAAHHFAIPSLVTTCMNKAMNVSKSNAAAEFFAAHVRGIVDVNVKELSFHFIKM